MQLEIGMVERDDAAVALDEAARLRGSASLGDVVGALMPRPS